ncbi:hypothetical protein [Streptomyces sp. WMMC940]|uniref:hypothetical protein n=1 Tax=Streptomyces sp. WMMC940 TaxID=3015153 RepID=UPI0022B61A87|nr:hypothetical protein [Streptomyces sp. WMMC940]MCZ7460134.1 hypothetical protein [Streptomyces sp. WMMC940]
MALSGAALTPATAAPSETARVRAQAVSQTFNFTGASQSFMVPANAVVTITADGAGGADNSGTTCSSPGTGGTGARVVTTLPITTMATTYTINVGGTGGKGCNVGGGAGGAGGFNGGGSGGSSQRDFMNGPGGGGASSVSANSTLLVVAGGGGAAHGGSVSNQAGGGNGGTPDAGAGGDGASVGGSPGSGGDGGSTTTSTPGAGGAPGVAPPCVATAGGNGTGFSGATVGTGGAGGDNSGACGTFPGAGGGGGGGYFAGGGGGAAATTGAGADGGGGGGGSSFAIPTGTGTTYSTSPLGTANNNGEVTISYEVVTPPPSLTITKRHRGKFDQGKFDHGKSHRSKRAVFTITVGNDGQGPTDGTPVMVQDTLPPGLTALRLTGPGWSCVPSTLTCTRSDVLEPGRSYPPITLTVRVSCGAPARITNTATVTGGGDPATHTATSTIRRGEHCKPHRPYAMRFDS